MMREVHRTIAAFAGPQSMLPARSGPPISKTRAIAQVVLSLILVPICLWALFWSARQDTTARNAASALLAAIVTFWLKD